MYGWSQEQGEEGDSRVRDQRRQLSQGIKERTEEIQLSLLTSSLPRESNLNRVVEAKRQNALKHGLKA